MGKLRLLSRSRCDPGWLLVLVLAGFAALPLLTHAGLPNTADGPVHLMRLAELNQAWRDGILYPRWAPHLAYGYGMPLFSYAPPLLYHVSQLLHLSGLALDEAMKGTLLLALALYGLGMYLLGRDLFGPRAGLLAAGVYLYAPYRLRELYIQGNYGQWCGLAFYPLILWAFYRLTSSRQLRFVILAALALAGLLLSHNISTMLFMPLWLGYLLFLLLWKLRRPPRAGMAVRLVWLYLLAIGLGLGLAAFFWLPAFVERDMVRLSGITTGFFDFRNNFIAWSELLAWPRRLDLSAINPYFPLALGPAQLILGSLGVATCLAGRLLRRAGTGLAAAHTVLFGLAGLAYSLMALPLSRPVWEAFPFLELTEFPWRMLGPALLCAALAAGALVYWLERLAGRRRHLVANLTLAGGLLFTLGTNLVYLFPAQFIEWGTPGPAQVMSYELHSGAIGTTSTGEFLPRWAERYPKPDTFGGALQATGDMRDLPRLEPAELPPGAHALTLRYVANEALLAVSSPQPFTATFRILYWPGWQVWLGDAHAPDGDWQQITQVQVSRPEGLIQARLPAGEYRVSLRLTDTPVRRLAGWLSLAAGVGLGGLVVIGLRQRPGKPHLHVRRLPARPALIGGALLAAALLISRPMAAWFQLRSAPGEVYGAQYRWPATLGEQLRLLAFDLPAGAGWPPGMASPAPASGELPALVQPAGQPLEVVLYWQAQAPLSINYRVFVHLDAANGQTYANVDHLNPADIPTSRWPPGLYLRHPLRLELPADLPPVRYTLTAGAYDPETGARLPLTSCERCPAGSQPGEVVPLAHVWVLPALPLDETAIAQRLDVRLGEKIELVGCDLPAGGRDTGEASDRLASDRRLLRFSLYWRSRAPLTTRYTVFVHAVDAQGRLLAQADGPPLGGLYPTDAWLPGQLIQDSRGLALPAGVHALLVGLYDADTVTRLPAIDASGQRLADDAVRLEIDHAE